jgi:molybdate transport system substrate-binding protein
MAPAGRRPAPFAVLAVLAAVVVLGAACASSTTSAGTAAPAPGAVTGTITVAAATSLTAPFTTIGADFERSNPGSDVTFTFDSSTTLANQIRSGAATDVFAPADEATMNRLAGEDLIAGPPQVFARNRLAIVVKKGNPRGVRTLADLATAGTVSLCGADAPCGRYADQILTQAGVTIPADRITRGQNVKATFAAVAEGDAEAGIVYATDVTGGKVEAVTIPDTANAIAVYPIGAVTATGNGPAARAFVAYLLSPPAQAVLAAAGFLPPA